MDISVQMAMTTREFKIVSYSQLKKAGQLKLSNRRCPQTAKMSGAT